METVEENFVLGRFELVIDGCGELLQRISTARGADWKWTVSKLRAPILTSPHGIITRAMSPQSLP